MPRSENTASFQAPRHTVYVTQSSNEHVKLYTAKKLRQYKHEQ